MTKTSEEKRQRHREKALEKYHSIPIEERTLKQRHYKLQYMYGITETDYQKMLEEQNGVCAICGINATIRKGAHIRLSVDHCHDTGKVRGLLCNRCNHAIGVFKDDPTLLKKAMEYLT